MLYLESKAVLMKVSSSMELQSARTKPSKWHMPMKAQNLLKHTKICDQFKPLHEIT